MTASPQSRLLGAYAGAYPDEVADRLLGAAPGEAAVLLAELPLAQACALIERLPTQDATEVLAAAQPDLRDRLIGDLDASRAAILLRAMDAERRDTWLATLEPALAEELRQLLSYPPGTAGYLMQSKLVAYTPATSVQQVLDRLSRVPPEQAEVILVVDSQGVLRGALPLALVVRAGAQTPLSALLDSPPPRVPATAPEAEVLAAFEAAHIARLPVVDGSERLLGVIDADAVVAAARDEASADLATLVGASKEERALSPVTFTVRKRLPWLNINLLTAFLAAAVVGLFEQTIAQVTALAVLLPVVAGQSGNTGAQSLAVVIRGLALREIRARNWARVVVKESLAGLINGVVIAVVTVLGVYLWSGSLGLCLVIFLAMIVSMVIAGVSGAAIPLILTSLRQDPAQSGSIVLTTVTDVMGFFSFLGLATLFAGML